MKTVFSISNKEFSNLYPSGMLVAKLGNNGSEEEQTLAYTKHYFAGTQRMSSKIGTTENLGDYLQDWFTSGTGGPVDVVGSSHGVLENAEEGVVQVYDEFDIEPPVYDSDPVFIPVQSFVHGDNEIEQYFFHPDHLGSTSYITNLLGEVSQHMEYFAFGETFVEEHRSSNNSPYKYNGKELDEETGLYYYGARYYSPRESVWLSVDPLASYDPIQNSEHYIDGQHNGGVFNAKNLNVYGYCYQNPVLYLDPNGKQVNSIKDGVGSGKNVTNDITASVSRPAMKSIDGIVLHRTVSSSASSAITTAKNHKGATGFHIVIDKDGSTIQIVNFNNRANHVGKQKTDIGNYNSIGIEVVGNYNNSTQQWDPLTPEQIESTAQAVYTMMNEYGLTIDDVFPHEDVSWKTAGEGQVVMDAIDGRLNELINPVVDEKPKTNIYEERRLQKLIGSPEKMDGGIRSAYDAKSNNN